MQTSREVIDGLLRGGGAERVGLYDSPWPDTIRKWTQGAQPADGPGLPRDLAKDVRFDMLHVGGFWGWAPRPDLVKTVEETDEWRIVRNGAGAYLKWWKNKSGTPEHVKFTMTSREIWEADFRPHVVSDLAARVSDKTAAALADGMENCRKAGLWGFYGNEFVWEIMRASMGDMTLYTSLIEDAGWVRDFCRCYTDVYKVCMGRQIEAGRPDGIWLYEDLGYRDRLFASPRIYAELIFPHYAEMVEFFHGHGLPVVLHTCGLTEPLVPLIIEAGFDALNPMEVKAGNDIFRMAEQYAARIAFIGGLDARVLESGDRGLIRRRVTELVEGMKARGARYVFGSDHSISTNVAYEDFLLAVEVYREHMMY